MSDINYPENDDLNEQPDLSDAFDDVDDLPLTDLGDAHF